MKSQTENGSLVLEKTQKNQLPANSIAGFFMSKFFYSTSSLIFVKSIKQVGL